MSLIFDGFPDLAHAERFIRAVGEKYPELECQWFLTDAEAQEADPFPGELVPPIVHVSRPYAHDDATIAGARELGMDGMVMTGAEIEKSLELGVDWFGGRYVGT